jgi:hypothetical protein
LADDDQQERRQQSQSDLDSEESWQVQPVRVAGLHELHFQPVDERVGQHPAGSLAHLPHDRDRLARRWCRLRQPGEEVGAGGRGTRRQAPPEDADRTDQRQSPEDDCEIHVRSVPVIISITRRSN